MKVLQSSEYYFGLNGILVLNKSRSASIKAFIKNFICIFLMGPFMCETAGAFIYYHPDQIEHCITASVSICAGVLVTGKYLSLKLNEKQIKQLIDTLQETVDKAPTLIREMYFNAEKKGRRLTKTAVTTMLCSFVLILGSCSFCAALYNIKMGQFDTTKWFQVIHIVIPYERQTVTVYFIKLIITLVMGYEYAMTLTPSVTFLMNCHGLLEVGFFHIKSCFVEMDESAQRSSQSNSKMNKIRMLCVIELQNRLLGLADLLSKIMSGPMFFQLLCNVGLTAGALNFLKSDEFNFETIEGLVTVIPTIFLIFLYCYFATRISTNLEQIGDVACQSNWYDYPIEMQKSIILIIRRAQVPFQFNGLKMFKCNMEIFAAILRLICSYYLILSKIKRY